MINNIKKDLTIDLITDRQAGRCNGCAIKYGMAFADLDRMLYLTVSWDERDYTAININKSIKENYCYRCAMDLFDSWRQGIRETYFKKHLEKVNR